MDKFQECFENMSGDKVALKKIQNRLCEMAKVIIDIFEKNDIEYTMAYGTLLGAVRHKGFIPWDDDFDLCLTDDVYDKAIKVLKRDLPDDMMIEDEESEPLFFHAWARVKDKNTIVYNELSAHDNLYKAKGINLDLYRMRRMKLSELATYRYNEVKKFFRRKYDKGIITKDEYEKSIIDTDNKFAPMLAEKVDNDREILGLMLDPYIIEINELYPLQKMKFDKYLFYAPHDCDSILRREYGEYMELPPEGKFGIHFNKVEFLNEK